MSSVCSLESWEHRITGWVVIDLVNGPVKKVAFRLELLMINVYPMKTIYLKLPFVDFRSSTFAVGVCVPASEPGSFSWGPEKPTVYVFVACTVRTEYSESCSAATLIEVPTGGLFRSTTQVKQVGSAHPRRLV